MNWELEKGIGRLELEKGNWKRGIGRLELEKGNWRMGERERGNAESGVRKNSQQMWCAWRGQNYIDIAMREFSETQGALSGKDSELEWIWKDRMGLERD